MSMTDLRVAAFQRCPVFDDASQILALLINDLVWCAEHDVHLAVFPECYLQGYDTDADTISRRAVEIQDDLVARLRRVTKDFPTELVIGFVEKRGQHFFNTALVIRDGVLLGAYSKTHPNEPAFKAGSEYPVFNLFGYRYGINICNDANYPASALALSTQGADLLCYPLNNMLRPQVADKWRKKSVENLQARAKDTGCWVLSADVVGRTEGKVSHGCTCIVSPAGEIMSQVAEDSEGIAMFDIQ